MENDTSPPSEIKSGVGWIKAPRNPDALELIRANPNAFVLAYIIAFRARFTDGFHADGLTPGEAMLGDFENYGMSMRQYRTAKQQLATWHFATFKTTTKGTIGKLIDTRLFNPLNVLDDNQNGNQPTTERQASDKQATTNKELKKEKKERIKEVGATSPSKTAEEIISELSANTAYVGIDVKCEYLKMQNWCTANRKQASYRRFVNWLNHCDKPLPGLTKPPVGGNF